MKKKCWKFVEKIRKTDWKWPSRPSPELRICIHRGTRLANISTMATGTNNMDFSLFLGPENLEKIAGAPMQCTFILLLLIPRGINMDQYEGTFHVGRPWFFLDFQVRKTVKNPYYWSPWPLWKCLPALYLGVCKFWALEIAWNLISKPFFKIFW